MTAADRASTSAGPSPRPVDHSGSETYRGRAGHYDQRTDAFRHWRELLVDQLSGCPAKE